MSAAWLLAAHYLRRAARKPWLVVFLISVPFLLLLAEYAAFGRPTKPEPLRQLHVSLAGIGASQRAALVSCLDRQPGSPVIVSNDEAEFRLTYTANESAPRLIPASASARQSDALLLQSIFKLCEEPSAAIRVQLIRRPTNAQSSLTASRDFLARFFPGLALFGALFVSQALATLLWRDQETGVQLRLRTFPLNPASLTWGPFLFLATGVAAVLLIILSAGVLALGAGVNGLVLMFIAGVGFASFAAGLQLLIGAFVPVYRTAQAVSSSTTVILAFLCGGFVPLETYPRALRQVAYLLPNGAGQLGISRILQGNMSAIAAPLSVVWLWAALLMFLAIIFQSRRFKTS